MNKNYGEKCYQIDEWTHEWKYDNWWQFSSGFGNKTEVLLDQSLVQEDKYKVVQNLKWNHLSEVVWVKLSHKDFLIFSCNKSSNADNRYA